jgi:hypothetical protein
LLLGFGQLVSDVFVYFEVLLLLEDLTLELEDLLHPLLEVVLERVDFGVLALSLGVCLVDMLLQVFILLFPQGVSLVLCLYSLLLHLLR